MSETPDKRKHRMEAEEVKEILGAVSTEVPGLIKSIIASVFSEEAGKNMGKAAAAFYKELKDSGMPDAVAVKMTQEYISVFTSLGDVLRKVGGRGDRLRFGASEGKAGVEAEGGTVVSEVEREVERRVKQRLAERQREEDEEDED
jgi:hypothetical protein